MVGETAWLDGKITWQNGRVAWESDRGTVVPGVSDIALAQRRLNQIASYPHASAHALGDAGAWLDRRISRLELAKYLSNVSAPDIFNIASRAQAGNSEALRKLVSLLPVEALSANRLPTSPGTGLVACGERAEDALLEYLNDADVPLAGHAMAALVLGAIYRQTGDPATKSNLPPLHSASQWLRHAYNYGLRFGLPSDPTIVLGFLSVEDGTKLARRYTAVERAPGPFALPGDTVREMLFTGIHPLALVDVAEALQVATPLAERIMDYRDKLPEISAHREDVKRLEREERRIAAAQLHAERKQILEAIVAATHEYLRLVPRPEVVYNIVTFSNLVLNLDSWRSEMKEYILNTLRHGLQVPAEVAGMYLELVVQKQEEWGDRDKWPEWWKTTTLSYVLDALEDFIGIPTANMLKNCGDAELVRQALDMDVNFVLIEHRWKDRDLYRWALSLIKELDLLIVNWVGRKLCSLLDYFPTARAARATLQPFFAAIMQAPQSERADIFMHLTEAVTFNRRFVTRTLPRLTRYVPRLVAFERADKRQGSIMPHLAKLALALDSKVPDRADAWLKWLMQHISQAGGEPERDWSERLAVSLGGALALAVSDGDLQRFQAVARVALRFEFDYQVRVLEDTIGNLERYPGLHTPLARMFPRQPRRCVELIVRLGLAQRLGPLATQPIALLSEGTAGIDLQAEDLSPEWRTLLEIAPEHEGLVKEYFRAQQLRGVDIEMSSGVRDIIGQRTKLSNELAFIEAKLQAQPERKDLASRAQNLRERLADQKKHLRSIAEEVGERLEQVTAEAQLATAEHVVMSCYRRHLNTVAGPVPDDYVIDEDMLNAILLTVDIENNRRLLRTLLRAYIRGDRDWSEEQPANVLYLDSLRARGVDVAAWLGRHPKRYACKGAHGGYVRMALERDPLHVLQMGNYFDTCLSFGGVNAFSTVANATELNKRVIYARDGKDRVVGRKLVAINDKGGLVAFRTYFSLDWVHGGKELNDIFRRYATSFAEACRLEMHNDGTVPNLLTPHWYDDGIVDWNEDIDPNQARRSPSVSTPPRRRTSRVSRVPSRPRP